MQKEKVRVYSLARELNVESKDLLDLCRQAGLDVKNQLSSLDSDQQDLVVQLVKNGGAAPATAATSTSPKTTASLIPTPSTSIPVLSARPVRRDVEAPRTIHQPPPIETAIAPAETIPPAPTAKAPHVSAVAPSVPVVEARATEAALPAASPLPVSAAAKSVAPPITRVPDVVSPRPVEVSGRMPDLNSKGPAPSSGRVPDLNSPRPEGVRPARKREVPRPGLSRPGLVAPPPLKPRPQAALKKPQQPIAQKPIARPPESLSGGTVNVQDLLKKTPGSTETLAPAVDIEDDDGTKKGPGGVAGRDKRHQQRANRAKERKGRGEGESKSTRVLLPGVEDDRPQRVKDRLKKAKQKHGPKPRQGKVPIQLPITVRSLSEAIGMKSGDLLFRLRDQGAPVTISINSIVEPDVAESLALDSGCELDVKRPVDLEGELLTDRELPDNPDDMRPRAPIVTIMGHVDHGKTSLLDKIRKSNVVATEAGGITQVIRAWRVDHGGRPVTFLDTPGHEAFTKMRARGAQVTDIAVIVVAADDGVMPQTEEAINHAKAAKVPIVVAINKVDLPNANLNKTRQQLYSHNLLPDNMGGDIPFVETSAATGKGIDELLDNLSIVAETLLELKANPSKPARGTCLEAMLSEGEGVFATLLVQDGTLRRGDVIVCGPGYGRVRAMYDDLGRPIQEAGPSVPVRITGLDVVPNADDHFQAVDDLSRAREIAERRKSKLQESNVIKREPTGIATLGEAKIDELKVILKADFRGSIEAIRKEMEKLDHDEVRVRLLHMATGGITESDVQLALTSPRDTIIVGFNVVPDDRARLLAEEKGVQIRQYDIIYNLTDDIRSALEGKLKPREDVIHLGRAVVRNTFKISRVGTIAGCYVTQGTIERSAKVRLIREGVVIYPPAERTASLESLKRFKEDSRDVREGFECGIKIAGYDDVKVGDVIEAYRVEQVKRTL